MVVGCSHSGVEQIVADTKKVMKNNIELVLGGFHLLPFDSKKTMEISNCMKKDLGVHRVAPAHYNGHLAFRVLMDLYKTDYLYAGLSETIRFK